MIFSPDFYINVFVTKNKKFRAQIQGWKKPGNKEEITVGGVRWNRGAFLEIQPEILRRCRKILQGLDANLSQIEENANAADK